MVTNEMVTNGDGYEGQRISSGNHGIRIICRGQHRTRRKGNSAAVRYAVKVASSHMSNFKMGGSHIRSSHMSNFKGTGAEFSIALG